MTTCRLVPATLPTASSLAHVRTAVVPWRFAVVRAATDGSVVGTDYFNHFSTTSVLPSRTSHAGQTRVTRHVVL